MSTVPAWRFCNAATWDFTRANSRIIPSTLASSISPAGVSTIPCDLVRCCSVSVGVSAASALLAGRLAQCLLLAAFVHSGNEESFLANGAHRDGGSTCRARKRGNDDR